MRVAICQMHSGPDVEDNLDEAEALVRAAADEGADLAALPEYLEFMGPAADRRAVAQPVPGSTADRLSAVAADRGSGSWPAASSRPTARRSTTRR